MTSDSCAWLRSYTPNRRTAPGSGRADCRGGRRRAARRRRRPGAAPPARHRRPRTGESRSRALAPLVAAAGDAAAAASLHAESGRHASLPQIGERGRQRLREVRTVDDGPEVLELARSLGRRAAAPAARAPGRRAPPAALPARRRRDPTASRAKVETVKVGDRSEAAHDQVADPRAHGRGADDDGERSQRVVALELGDALAERVFELRETAADEQPQVCVGPAGHGRGERITRSGRVRPAAAAGRIAAIRSARG